jgi:ribosomal protein S27E
MPEQTKPQQFRCPGCAADMEFDPASGLMKCRFCGQTAEVPTVTKSVAPPHSLDEFLAKTDDSHLRPLTVEALEVSCEGCGSRIAFEPPEVAGTCPFCGADIVAQPKAADPMLAPDGLLPAKVPKNNAQTQVREWLQTRWFAPNALKRMARQEAISGVYLPFWDYAADTRSQYRGERGDHYWETEVYTDSDDQGRPVQRTRQVQRTRWTPVAGEVSRRFDNVLVVATRSIAEKRLDALEPWDLESLCAYEPAYLSGFKAQRYQVELPAGFDRAKSVMQATIEQDAARDIAGDEQRVDNIDTAYSNTTFRHLLLPVWIGAYRFQAKVYQVVVNARTGEVQGERPYSAWKIAALVGAILFVLAILLLLRSQN